jgi:hypothetical protein
MKITEITVHVGRVIPHPLYSYSNLKPGMSFKATICEGEDPYVLMAALHKHAERMLEGHCEWLRKSLVNADVESEITDPSFLPCDEIEVEYDEDDAAKRDDRVLGESCVRISPYASTDDYENEHQGKP